MQRKKLKILKMAWTRSLLVKLCWNKKENLTNGSPTSFPFIKWLLVTKLVLMILPVWSNLQRATSKIWANSHSRSSWTWPSWSSIKSQKNKMTMGISVWLKLRILWRPPRILGLLSKNSVKLIGPSSTNLSITRTQVRLLLFLGRWEVANRLL